MEKAMSTHDQNCLNFMSVDVLVAIKVALFKNCKPRYCKNDFVIVVKLDKR